MISCTNSKQGHWNEQLSLLCFIMRAAYRLRQNRNILKDRVRWQVFFVGGGWVYSGLSVCMLVCSWNSLHLYWQQQHRGQRELKFPRKWKEKCQTSAHHSITHSQSTPGDFSGSFRFGTTEMMLSSQERRLYLYLLCFLYWWSTLTPLCLSAAQQTSESRLHSEKLQEKTCMWCVWAEHWEPRSFLQG